MSRRFLIDNFRWGLTGELQAMLIDDGYVVYRGKHFTSSGVIPTIDLKGRYLLPALIESHCHILSTGLDLRRLHLDACRSIDDVLDAIRDGHLANPEGWLLAVHYDQNNWEGPHVTRYQLDEVAPGRPVLLRHVNGHAGVANSVALQSARLSESEPDPAGGSYGRDESGAINGALFENALNRLYNFVPKPTLEQMTDAILAAGHSMHEYGIGCAHDMLTGGTDIQLELEAYKLAAERGNPIDVRLYVQWSDALGKNARFAAEFSELRTRDHVRRQPVIAGLKIFADGAIGSSTAAIYGRYGDFPESGKPEVSGQLMYPPERLNSMVREAHNAGWAVATHAIGNYGIDLVLDAYEATAYPRRHRIEHAMMLDDAQIERLAVLGVSVSMQPEFLLRFGHTYLAQLGAERATKLNRLRSVADSNIPLSLSSDRPIVSGDPWIGISTAIERPDGFCASENLEPAQALAGYLSQAAAIGGDSPLYANLEEGAECRAIVVDSDPLVPGVDRTQVHWLEKFLPS